MAYVNGVVCNITGNVRRARRFESYTTSLLCVGGLTQVAGDNRGSNYDALLGSV